MTDVRLTATNPEDSSVVPVACNAKGELKLEEIPDQSFDGNLEGDLTVTGNAYFAGNVISSSWASGLGFSLENSALGGSISLQTAAGASGNTFFISRGGTPAVEITAVGTAKFAGDVVIGSRGSQWMIVESGGLAHLIEQSSFKSESENYPKLRNIPEELSMVEQALAEVMEKLRMVPPAGWEVWDGSSKNS